jgi:hypothetical protein
MPIYMSPLNDESRLAFLKQAAKTGSQDLQAGNKYITEETHNKIVEFIPGFEKQINEINDSKSNRSKEFSESSEAFEHLQTCMRDMWEAARRKVNRLNLPAQMLTYYELPLDGKSPYPNTRAEWYVLAKKMTEGAENAVKNGYPPVLEPGAEELKEALVKAEKERGDVSEADREYDEAQEALEDSRIKAEELINDVMAELRFYLRKMDDSSQRRIMRSYGATFRFMKDEPEDEITEDDL